MSNEEWTTIVFRNGVKLDLPQTANQVIDQMAAASKRQDGSLSFVTLTLRGDAYAVVSAPEVIAVAARALTADGNMRMLPSAHANADQGAPRVTEIRRDAAGKMIGTVSRALPTA